MVVVGAVTIISIGMSGMIPVVVTEDGAVIVVVRSPSEESMPLTQWENLLQRVWQSDVHYFRIGHILGFLGYSLGCILDFRFDFHSDDMMGGR